MIVLCSHGARKTVYFFLSNVLGPGSHLCSTPLKWSAFVCSWVSQAGCHRTAENSIIPSLEQWVQMATKKPGIKRNKCYKKPKAAKSQKVKGKTYPAWIGWNFSCKTCINGLHLVEHFHVVAECRSGLSWCLVIAKTKRPAYNHPHILTHLQISYPIPMATVDCLKSGLGGDSINKLCIFFHRFGF